MLILPSFLISTHYTHYNYILFALNFTGLVFALFPKLPVVSVGFHLGYNVLLAASCTCSWLESNCGASRLRRAGVYRGRGRSVGDDIALGKTTAISIHAGCGIFVIPPSMRLIFRPRAYMHMHRRSTPL